MAAEQGMPEQGAGPVVCTHVCTALRAEELQAAIDRLTRALTLAADDVIAELVAERRELRRELALVCAALENDPLRRVR